MQATRSTGLTLDGLVGYAGLRTCRRILREVATDLTPSTQVFTDPLSTVAHETESRYMCARRWPDGMSTCACKRLRYTFSGGATAGIGPLSNAAHSYGVAPLLLGVTHSLVGGDALVVVASQNVGR